VRHHKRSVYLSCTGPVYRLPARRLASNRATYTTAATAATTAPPVATPQLPRHPSQLRIKPPTVMVTPQIMALTSTRSSLDLPGAPMAQL
jgi:hypothetical protein